jgi:hypothetical protein
VSAASEYLNSLGIPGLRYLDGDSRDKGEGSHNYVVWKDEAVEIQRTFYHGLEAPEAVGGISPETAARIGLPEPGPMLLLESDLEHIEKKHGEQFRRAGFADARRFIDYVLSNVDAVYAGRGKTFSFVSRGRTKDGRVFAELEVVEDNGRYRITTAHPIRSDFYGKSTPLWERAQTSHSGEGTPSAISGHNGERLNLTRDAANVKASLNAPINRGYTTFGPDQYKIVLGENANLSTDAEMDATQ